MDESSPKEPEESGSTEKPLDTEVKLKIDLPDNSLVGPPAQVRQDIVVQVDEVPVEAVDPWALPELQDDGVPWKELTAKGKAFRICNGFIKCIGLLLLLYVFVCSLDFLSTAFRLVGGKQASGVMSEVKLLKNPVVGLMLGVIATVIVQSSSTSSSIVITMVGSGLLQVRNAIPIIMGANIGTSVTNTFVSLSQVSDRNRFRRAFAAATVHDMFNWLTVIILLPIEVGTGYLEKVTERIINATNWEQNRNLDKAFLTVLTKPFTTLIVQLDKEVLEGIALNSSAYVDASLLKQCCDISGNSCSNCGYLMGYLGLNDLGTGIVMLAFSLVLLCTCLCLIVKLLKSVLKGQIAAVIKNIVNAEPRFPLNHLVGYLAILVGCCMTILVQSSSIFTSALTPLAGIGVITVERMYPLTLGSNVGTTTTGILAALAADPKRLKYTLQIAFCHLLFNINGIILFYPIPFMRFPVPLAKHLGNKTAKYRWFAMFYLLLMFGIIPAFVFGLSVAGSITFMAVGIPLLVFLILVAIINILQCKRPSLLPLFFQNWNWLPQWMHSLDPLDRIVVKLCHFCRCRSCGIEQQASCNGQVLGIRPNQSKLNILDSRRSSASECHTLNGHENTGFAWRSKPESTRL